MSGESESGVLDLAWDGVQEVYGKELVWKLTSRAHCDFITRRAKPHVVQSLSELRSNEHSQLPSYFKIIYALHYVYFRNRKTEIESENRPLTSLLALDCPEVRSLC